MQDRILFYSSTRNYFEFSNFYSSPIDLDGHIWPTVEHYYQAQKSTDQLDQKKVREAPTPGKAKRLGRKIRIRPDWDEIKVDVMIRAVRAKFMQHADLRDLLLSTENATLHENSPHDMFWGIHGKDMLGKVLMQIREEIRDGKMEED
jgi:ribA/ribD-fused uncharacterized protein